MIPPGQDEVYLNGQYLPKREAALSVEDRGTLFGDGVYEVTRYYGGRPLAMAAHLARLRRSMEAIEIDEPDDVPALPEISDALVQRNDLEDAKVYWQVTRGPASPRNHAIPERANPSVLVMTYPAPAVDPHAACPAWTAILAEDRRWGDCWIKSTMLLPNTLARSAANRAGCDEAILQCDGRVTEGTSTNVLVVKDGVIRTHPANRRILGGITRAIVLELARGQGRTVREEAVTVEELIGADEVMLTGTTTHIAAVTHVDARAIGDGRPGPVTEALHHALMQHVLEQGAAPAP